MSYIGVSAAPTPAGVYTKAETETKLNDKLSTEGGELTGGLTVTPPVGESFVKLKSNTVEATSEVMLRGSDNDGFDAAYNSTLDQFRISRYVNDVYQNSPLVISADGRIGLGTSSPARQFVLNAPTPVMQFTNPTTGTTNNDGTMFYQTGTDFVIEQQDSGNIKVYAGGAERMRIDSAGRVTMPYQPCFNALNGSAQSGVVVVIFDSTNLNVGSGYSTSTNRFTAPVAGNYFFSAFVLKNSSSTETIIALAKNGTYVTGLSDAGGSNYISISVSGVVSLAAGDYVEVQTIGGSSSIYSNYRNFSGFLIG